MKLNVNVLQLQPFSKYGQCTNDISFWLPEGGEEADDAYNCNDFYDLVRSLGGDDVEQVRLIDDFYHAKKGQRSHCYRIVYRSMERQLTQAEANQIHDRIEKEATRRFGVQVR